MGPVDCSLQCVGWLAVQLRNRRQADRQRSPFKSWITLLRQDCRADSAAPAWTQHRETGPTSPQPSTLSLAAHMLGTKETSGSVLPRYSALKSRGLEGEEPTLRHSRPLDLRLTQGTTTSSVFHVKRTQWNERGQGQTEVRVTGQVQPSSAKQALRTSNSGS